jgi:TRAP-type C4-dicarboxylate transport system substrate-binding protein
MDGTRSRKFAKLSAGAAALALVLAGCGGNAEGEENGADSGDTGFEYGASQEEVNAVVEDLEPVTITFQPPAASENSVMAPAGTVFKEIVEERSNGKITVEMVWGQAIAGYDEVHDALADGRLDVAYTLPVYQPDEFPALNDIGTAMAGLSSSPFLGELVSNAVGNELGWQNESLLQSYEEQGLVPLTALAASGGYYTVCSDPVEDVDDWNGAQMRIASTAQSAQVTELGATPVSIEYTETYEALQRGTVDCTLGQLVPSAEGGIFEVAPHLGYTTDHSFSRAPGAYLAGSSFQDLPLAYQQIIFDSNRFASAGGMQSVIGGNAEAVAQAKEAGGEITAFTDEVQQQIGSYAEELTEEAVQNGHIDEDIVSMIAEYEEQWTAEIEELGYTDEGTTADFDEWYDEETDYMDYAIATYENSEAMNFRPE